jgi:hypothetical protein
VRTLIDARLPRPSVRRTSSSLIRQLLARGILSEFVNVDPTSGATFPTGALHVTPAPFRVVGSDQRPNPNMYALGIPTEGVRWFTQIGNGRPGPMNGFHADADAIALDCLLRPRPLSETIDQTFSSAIAEYREGP